MPKLHERLAKKVQATIERRLMPPDDGRVYRIACWMEMRVTVREEFQSAHAYVQVPRWVLVDVIDALGKVTDDES